MDRIFISLLIVLLLTSCTSKKTITVLTDRYESSMRADHSVVAQLSAVLHSIDINLQENVDTASLERTFLKRVKAKEADMAIVKNDILIDDSLADLRTVMPLFPDVFLMLCKKETSYKNITSLMEHGRVVMITDKKEEIPIINGFLESLKLDPRNVIFLKNPQEPATLQRAKENADVIIMFSSLNNPMVGNLLAEKPGFTLYSTTGKEPGSVIDGFSLKFPQVVPYLIPQGIFNGFPNEPVQTFAIYDVLVCHKDVEPELVYDFNESVFNAEARLAQDNFEFGLLTEKFNNHTFLFPLHAGTVAYLNRNQPSFWERYSELVGLAVSILAVIVGAISTSYHKLKQRKKDRIDEYYKRIIEIDDRAHALSVTRQELESMLQELSHIRKRAFQLLVSERIEANHAFIIFLLLMQSTVQRIDTEAEHLRHLSRSTFVPREN
ncbi:hypothetical protein KK083_16240 [Fulvivirgaceae bacterium PWU4]|uniref:Uncharacterized protein n=1 Tax=Chryseosolibacter histidini TaxID=2782349 RepID=A0AAP2DLH0_9BACT|nr:TAXI family TRAP transporter solute-binding subunit [Chryseosolibacter histidini]MBT1698441.1 hypothetical protein [Chryseosolibacter histidini]